MELFTAAGPAAVEAVRAEGGAVLLDLKLHDIPHTVSGAVRSAARLEAEMLTLHLAGGAAMIRAAVDAARGAGTRLRLVGITRLTSEPATTSEFAWSVTETALGAAALGLDGIVVSVHEAAAVRAACRPGFLIMAPGIRPAGAPADDQSRLAPPTQAAPSRGRLLPAAAPPPPPGGRDWSRLLEEVAMVERGHFLLSSGLHSPVYVQVARLLQHPRIATAVFEEMARPFADRGIQLVAGPATG